MQLFFLDIINSLFWRISFVLLIILIFLGLAYAAIAVYTSKRYYEETTQKLNAHVAQSLLDETPPFVNGKVNEEALGEIMHSMMAVNPNLEVYLLSPEGEILSFVVLYKKVKLKQVNIAPVKEFIQNQGNVYILGDDPKKPGEKKIFSAAEVREDGELLGYIYMILASEEYENIAAMLWDSYILRLGAQGFAVTLGAALIIGVILVWALTRNLRKITSAVNEFEKGNLKARAPVKSNDEISRLGKTFNKMADTLLANIDELKQIDSLRKELIANVSHDLRTPLSIIHGYMETLMIKQDTLDEASRAKYMNIIINNTEKLKRLVGELFELSQLESGQITPKPEPFSLTELLQDISGKFQLSARKKNIEITTGFEKTALMVYADVAMMERVIQNLLDNAIKYTPDDGRIQINLEKRKMNVEVSIINTGPGIPEKDLPKIFNRYYKAENYIHSASDSGLGLAIVKNILELHNSFIAVQSKIEEYTRFYFELPVYKGVLNEQSTAK